jgi:hypothetical protein
MTGLDTQVNSLISRINPAFSSLCSSDAIAFLLGSSNHLNGCLTGFALESIFSACSTSFLGTPGMSEGHQVKISQRSQRNSTSVLSYAGSRFTAMEVVLFGSVLCGLEHAFLCGIQAYAFYVAFFSHPCCCPPAVLRVSMPFSAGL